MRICIHCRKWYESESFHRNRLLWSYSSLLCSGNLFSHVFFISLFITSAEGKVKNSCHPGMSQSCFFGDKIGYPRFVGCRLYSAIKRSESRINSRYLEFTSISLIYSRKKELLFWLSRGLNRLTCAARQIRGDSKLSDKAMAPLRPKEIWIWRNRYEIMHLFQEKTGHARS